MEKELTIQGIRNVFKEKLCFDRKCIYIHICISGVARGLKHPPSTSSEVTY